MVKVSELISKRLIALSSAETAGTVENVIFDDKLTAGKLLKIYDDGGNDAETKYVELRRVKNTDSDACVIADKSFAFTDAGTRKTKENNPINKICFNQDGKVLGTVRDVVLENSAVKSILTDGEEFTPDKIISYSDKLIVINDTGKPIKTYKPKAARVPAPEKAAARKVSVHIAEQPQAIAQPAPAQQTAQQTAPTQQTAAAPEKTSDNVKLPSRVPPQNTTVISAPAQTENALSPYKFLIGKTLQKDIAADNGIIVLRKFAVIDETVIAAAKDHGKLVQLALHSD